MSLVYDRQDRSTGVAYVTYVDDRDAREAVREFDGANAYGQPIRLSLMPSAPARPKRNPFDNAVKPSRSLFERIEDAPRRRYRSASPSAHRPSDVTKPAPPNIDRYVPGERRRSPLSRRDTPRSEGGGRRFGERRDDGNRRGGRGRGRGDGPRTANGRPRKTQEELDAEMEDYWGSKDAAAEGGANGAPQAARNGGVTAGAHAPSTGTTTAATDDDIDMIE